MGRTSEPVPKEWTKGFGALCVIFKCLKLSLIPMKEEYAHKMTFFHHLYPYAQKGIFQKNEVFKTC